jgi:hypothetical protein
MNFNTRYKAQNIRNYFMTATFGLIIFLALMIFTSLVPLPEKYIYIFIGIGLLGYVWVFLKKYQYIEFSDDNGKIIFRYFKLIPTALEHRSIEIPQRFFVKYQIESSLMGMREEIVFFVKTKDGISKYPPVSLSILSESQKQDLLESLDAITAANQKF